MSLVSLNDRMSQLEKISIRKAVSSDLPQMMQIMDAALETPTNDDEIDEQLKRLTERLNNTAQFIFYVAEIDQDNLVGWCRGGRTVQVHKLVAGEEYECEIQTIFIHPKYQHRGIGRELWKVVWNDVLQLFHPKNFVVWSVSKEQAHRFYRSLGGTEKEQRTFNGSDLSTAFVWHDLRPFESASCVILK